MNEEQNNGEIRTITTGRNDGILTVVLALIVISLASFAIIGGGAWMLAAAAKAPKPYIWGVISGAASMMFFWIYLLRKVVYLAEKWFGVDINGDGVKGNPADQGTQEPEQTKYLTPMWIPHENGASREDLPTPRDTTLPQMAIILMQRGFDYFTADHFTTPKYGTQLMSRDYWDKTFFPSLRRGRLAIWKDENNHRLGIELTGNGKSMMTRLAGRAGEQQEPLPQTEAVYASDTPLPRRSPFGLNK